MQLATVIPFPKPEPTQSDSPDAYLIRHEDRLELDMLESPGRRVMRIRKTFFDGSDRIELSLEREVTSPETMDAILGDLEAVVTAYFDA